MSSTSSSADHEFEKKLDRLSMQRDTVDEVISSLRDELPIERVADELAWARRFWVGMGIRYRRRKRVHEALHVFHALYDRLLQHQSKGGRVHKGEPLYQIAICHSVLGHPVLLRRYIMLALCEDAVEQKGQVDPYSVGTYRWLVRHFGFRHADFNDYVRQAWEAWNRDNTSALFPEWMLQELDHGWQTVQPTPSEASVYWVNPRYVGLLVGRLGEGDRKSGKSLERLSHYLISAIPGFRAHLRKHGKSTEHDVIGVVEGQFADFRSEIGRYILCQCKDWRKPANFKTMASFCHVLDSTQTCFGILCSKNGITGQKTSTDAERERVKAFHQRGIVVVVVSEGDLRDVQQGVSFITMLRDKYERRRFDLHG
jgi:hypothetical protein